MGSLGPQSVDFEATGFSYTQTRFKLSQDSGNTPSNIHQYTLLTYSGRACERFHILEAL